MVSKVKSSKEKIKSITIGFVAVKGVMDYNG